MTNHDIYESRILEKCKEIRELKSIIESQRVKLESSQKLENLLTHTEIKELKSKIGIAEKALEKLNFTDDMISEFMRGTNSDSRIALLKVVGEIAKEALQIMRDGK
mgnify:CR=1 FL=1